VVVDIFLLVLTPLLGEAGGAGLTQKNLQDWSQQEQPESVAGVLSWQGTGALCWVERARTGASWPRE
jgi:hypothetical protein